MLMYGNSLSLHCFSGSCPHICTNALALYSHFSLNYLLHWSVSTAGGAQGCKGSMHYTSIASLYGALMTRALLRIKPFDLRQMFFNMLRGKAPFTSYIPTSHLCSVRKLVWLIDNIVLDNKCQRLKVYDVVYDDLSTL